MALTSSNSALASDWERIRCSTLRVSPKLPIDASQRGLSGMKFMPTQSAIAGRVAMTSIQRQIPPASPKLLPR
ncbi:hypothetical protein SRABI128_05578 [Microbacterium sp. Bi128]|nr:hypothetical protein SRABI128_05578 [Microbacterium sp. Bi128]